jgi:hypothetical protein
LLEAEVAKENEADDEDEYDDEESYCSQDDDPFQPESIKKDIEVFLESQTSFQKVQLLCVKLTNQWMREVLKHGKVISNDPKNVEARGSPVKDFFIR